MYISINWIKDFVNLDGISEEELVKRFNLSTAEIEGVEHKGENTRGVVFGKILSIENHPKSTKLHILKVDLGDRVEQIVCGAPNVRVGMITCVATVGGCVCGHDINKATLVGVESNGMCCSANELGIGADDTGIMDITEDVKIGMDIKDYLPVDDIVLEIDNKTLTNRPDLWGHYGLAREFAAIFNRELKPLSLEDLSKYNNLPKISIKNESENCYRYSAIKVDNILEQKSPLKMALRLCYAGMRDINLLADITNYVMLELGQPMHAFDSEKVNSIKVVNAKDNEKLLTLDNVEYDIPKNAILIEDGENTPVAIAGIKGGLKASISDNTKNVLFESATFEAVAVRKTSRSIGLVTDASQRYEKSLDPEMTKLALERIVKILLEIDKNVKVSSSFSDEYTKKYDTKVIKINKDFISSRIGEQISTEKIVNILTSLKFDVITNNEEITVTVPSFRATKDVSMKEDLVEEIARMFGYDNITPTPLAFEPKPIELNKNVKEEYEVKKLLAEKYDATEIHSYIWNYKDFNEEHFIDTLPVVRLLDSSNAGQSGIRNILAPTLLKVVYENRNNLTDMRVFEVGRVAESLDENNLVVEKKKLSVVFASQTKSVIELFDNLKQFIFDYAKNNLNINLVLQESDKPNFMHPVNTFRVTYNSVDYGYIGVVHPKTARSIDKRLNIVLLEVDFGNLIKNEGDFKKAVVPSKFQATELDLSILAPKEMLYKEITDKIDEYNSKILQGYVLKDIYESDKLLGQKSVTITFTLSSDHTLEGQEIEDFLNGLISHLEKYKLIIRR